MIARFYRHRVKPYIHRGSLALGALVVLNIALLGIIIAPRLSAHLDLGTYPEVQDVAAKASAWSFADLSSYFRVLAQEKGAVYAYKVLGVAKLPPNIDLHLLAHEVGDVLYTQEGIDGIKECTSDFRNACSHSIVIGALQDFGTGKATIPKIQAACKLAPGGPGAYTMCFHGLGHGVFAYFGYDMQKAVAFCKRLGTREYGNQEFTQCVGGMIMELVDGGGHDHERWLVANKKYLDPHDPLAPCDGKLIPQEAKSFCYSYLTPHLFQVAGADLGHPDPATFPAAFKMCDPITDTNLKYVCYGSFGKEFIPLAGARDIRRVDAFSDEEYKTAIDWCMLAPYDEAREACI